MQRRFFQVNMQELLALAAVLRRTALPAMRRPRQPIRLAKE
jgi:hypothetical protein